jgi:hypothetical protein
MMGIDKIKLGPRSRILEKREQEDLDRMAKVVEDAMSSPAVKAKLEKGRIDLLARGHAEVDLAPEDFEEMVALQASLPPPAGAPVSLRGCGCGKQHIPPGVKSITSKDGVLHRYSAPCYSEDPEGVRTYYDFTKRISLEDRVTALEKIVTELLAERQDMVDADAEAAAAQDAADVRGDLAFDADREDRIFGRHR